MNCRKCNKSIDPDRDRNVHGICMSCYDRWAKNRLKALDRYTRNSLSGLKENLFHHDFDHKTMSCFLCGLTGIEFHSSPDHLKKICPESEHCFAGMDIEDIAVAKEKELNEKDDWMFH